MLKSLLMKDRRGRKSESTSFSVSLLLPFPGTSERVGGKMRDPGNEVDSESLKPQILGNSQY